MTGRQVPARLLRVLRVLRVLREVALTAGAVAGTVCLLFALLGATAGVRTLAFTSGSMSPTIETGDLAVTRPVALADVAVGDVVSLADARGVRITHRVVEVDAGRGELRLRGDANDVPDPLPYRADRVDRVLLTVPAGGYVLTWLTSPTATVLLGAYLVFLLYVLWPRRTAARPPPAPPAPWPGRRHRAGPTLGALLVIALVPGGSARPEPTLAAWTDPAPITGTTVTAYTVPKPAITGCSVSLLTVTVTWTAVSSPYPLTYKAVVAETGTALTVTGTGATRSATYLTAIQTVTGASQTIRITAALTATPAWTSVPSNQVIRLPLVGLAPSCGAAS